MKYSNTIIMSFSMAYFFYIIAIVENVSAAVNEKQPDEMIVEKRTSEVLKYIQEDSSPLLQKNIDMKQHMALLLLFKNEDVNAANQMVLDYCGQNQLTEYVGKMVPKTRCESLFRIYLLSRTRALLTPKAKTAIEDYAWNLLTKYNRDISREDADKSYWDSTGSENHFVNDRRRYTLALHIVRESQKYGPETKLEEETVSSHYNAWVEFWLRYFRQRCNEGTDTEVAHPSSYGLCTVGVYYDIYDLTDSDKLRDLAGKFLTLYWAEVASEFEPRTGQRAGWAASRNPFYAGERIWWAQPLLYTYGWHDKNSENCSLGLVPFLTSSYRPPEILKAIAQDGNRGCYLFTSRRAGLQAKERDDHIIFDEHGDSHIRRDVYYTPDYALSTITLNPTKYYDQHLTLAQTMGVTFASDIHQRISIMGSGYYARRAITGITGKDVSIIARDPNASHGEERFLSNGTRVFLNKGSLWDNKIEDNSGWFFTRSGDAYVAIRIPGGYTVTDQAFTWPNRKLKIITSPYGYFLELKDMWAPVVIQMGRNADYKSFEAFQKSVLANICVYENGKLTYTSLAGDTYEYWAKSTKIPHINGSEVNLNPVKTYSSPFMSMHHGESKVIMRYPRYKDLVLDFNHTENPGY